ncbi:hypothetical protein [Celeribacter arenosi]|uniref:Dienelactone hydrolase family protein n=1 Tax=Celeribacter arenosi TaxID=792649 RepID=A0ABP7JUS0_9RHOB
MAQSTFDLQYLVRPPKDPANPAPVLFLFHGFASNERNLHPLSKHVPEEWLVITARGTIKVAPNQYKWFEVERIDDWFEGGRTDPRMVVDVESERAARHQVSGFIVEMVRAHNADPNQIVVAGFSQGAALSLNLFLTSPSNYLASGAFGGRIMDGIKQQIPGHDALQAKPVFLGFGNQDPFISVEQAVATQSYLENLGLCVAVSKDDVGHTASGPQWIDFIRFIEALRTAQ